MSDETRTARRYRLALGIGDELCQCRSTTPRAVLLTTYERAPQDSETLLGMKGVGARMLRALALVSETLHRRTPRSIDPTS